MWRCVLQGTSQQLPASGNKSQKTRDVHVLHVTRVCCSSVTVLRSVGWVGWVTIVTLQLREKHKESILNSSNFNWKAAGKWSQFSTGCRFKFQWGAFRSISAQTHLPLMLFLWLCCLQRMKNTAGLKVCALLCDNPIPLSWGVVGCGH